MNTLASKIEDWLAVGLSVADVAATVGCRKDYVRAVRNRLRNVERYGSLRSPAENDRYNERKRERYWSDPDYRRRMNAKTSASNRRRRERQRAEVTA